MIDETEGLLADLRSRGATIETEALRRALDDRGVLWVADDSGHMLRTYFCDWEYDEDLYGKDGAYDDRTELSTVCLTAEEAVEIALNVWEENERLRSCLSDADENARQIMGEYRELESENARLREKLEFEHENNESIRRLFDAVAPRCGRPDCPSLVEYVEKLRELVRDMYGFIKRMDEDCGDVTFSDCFDYCKHDTAGDGCCKTGECWYDCRMRDLGIEVGG